ncbi:MAG: endonuclease NucS [Gallionella sp.]|nr:endonuclease NucS [Gallionella sp.]MDD4947387.1 endonuclease NucS [Gallionella sp.]MDD5613095.1 endonuclease NucS [Gallionella sp.]
MPIFKTVNGKLVMLNPSSINKERHVQKLVQENMPELMDMHCVASEYKTTMGRRIDTLALDNNGCPVIVEYKRNKNDNIINQSLSYLKWLKVQKQEFFEMLIRNRLDSQVLEGINLDWAHPRVVCIAESFSKFDLDTVEVVPLKIDLFRYRHYEDGLFSLDRVNLDENIGVAFDVQYMEQEGRTAVINSMKVRTDVSPVIGNLFDQLRDRVLEMDEDILEKPGKRTVAYRLGKNFAQILIRRDRLVIDLRPVDYEDPRGMVERIAQDYTLSLNRRVTLADPAALDYVCGLIEQSYKNVL